MSVLCENVMAMNTVVVMVFAIVSGLELDEGLR